MGGELSAGFGRRRCCLCRSSSSLTFVMNRSKLFLALSTHAIMYAPFGLPAPMGLLAMCTFTCSRARVRMGRTLPG